MAERRPGTKAPGHNWGQDRRHLYREGIYTESRGVSPEGLWETRAFDTHEPQFCTGQSFVSLLTGPGEPESLAVPVPAPTSIPPQTETQLQTFSLMPSNACEAVVGVHDVGSHSLGTSLSLQNIMGSPMNTTSWGSHFFSGR